ncbi:hypothetical protein [Streptomyces sp. Da 82-17]|uniref:hypothetical protein n=1 Tax=Streptomyces sp. Da 82-17 TaxID=3377116 RepID=UPI0038D459C5
MAEWSEADGTALLLPLLVVAALLIRTAVLELRRPGSARRQWSFVADRRALAGGAAVAVAVAVLGWTAMGWAAAAWAALVGTLTAYVLGRGGRHG